MLRSSRSVAFLAGAVLFIFILASLGYSNRDSWEFNSVNPGVEVIGDDVDITPIPADVPVKAPAQEENTKKPEVNVETPPTKVDEKPKEDSPTKVEEEKEKETSQEETDEDEEEDEVDTEAKKLQETQQSEKPQESEKPKEEEKPKQTESDDKEVNEPSNESATETEHDTKFPSNDQVFDILADMHKDIVKPTSSKYQPYGAFSWKLKTGFTPKVQDLMGEDLCIIDIDNRPFNASGQVFGDEMSWERTDHLHGLSLGVLNHWLYAKLHGYKYYFVTFDTPEDRRSSWEKPGIISKILKQHKTCVYLDSDAIFYHMDLPLEWLMNYWKIDPAQHSFALSWDPNFSHNKDQFGQLYFNTGFIIIQNNEKTFELLKDWDECTDEGGKYPDCKDFRFNAFGRPTDQGGFGTFVRYDYESQIQALPCSEANGFPEDPSECKGTFIRHMWSGKDTLIKIVTGHQFPGRFLPVIHKMARDDKKNFYFAKKDL